MKQIVVLGGNFAGMTAAIETARKLRKAGVEHKVTCISASPKFLFVPSLIWVAFGRRRVEDITFDIGPVFAKHGVDFIHDEAVQIDAENRVITTAGEQRVPYDYLVVATGVGLNFGTVPGHDKDYVDCIVTPPMAVKAYESFQRLVREPGPVVVGSTQGASCMGAAYEYLFNLEKELRRQGVREKVPLTWITPEPELGHFGIGGIRGGRRMLEMFMKMFKIDWVVDSVIKEIGPNQITLADGKVLPFKMAMLIPPFVGAKVVRETPGLGDEKGFLACNDAYQHKTYENIYAAGLAVEVLPPFKACAAPFGVPKTGFPADVQGKVVAKNIAYAVRGIDKREEKPFGRIPGICIMDAGHKEVFILTSSLFKPRAFEIMIPNVFYDFGKVMLEKYMLFKNRHGMAYLP
jgi:sulfide:quinone oxidoreductase